VVFAKAAAKAMLDAGDGMLLRGGRLATADGSDALDATAKTQLSSIFEKTGTHRQAELVRLLLDATEAKEVETGTMSASRRTAVQVKIAVIRKDAACDLQNGNYASERTSAARHPVRFGAPGSASRLPFMP
jgi:hypothetical protein